jgi:hypothetical protein
MEKVNNVTIPQVIDIINSTPKFSFGAIEYISDLKGKVAKYKTLHDGKQFNKIEISSGQVLQSLDRKIELFCEKNSLDFSEIKALAEAESKSTQKAPTYTRVGNVFYLTSKYREDMTQEELGKLEAYFPFGVMSTKEDHYYVDGQEVSKNDMFEFFTPSARKPRDNKYRTPAERILSEKTGEDVVLGSDNHTMRKISGLTRFNVGGKQYNVIK